MIGPANLPQPAEHGWTHQQASSGTKYYFNVKTGESRWLMPEELMTPEQRKIAAKTEWREYCPP